MVAAAALAGGLVIGGFAGRSFSSETQKSREMQKQLDRVTQEQKDYQHEVAEHFTDTAKLLRNMAESYRDVHNHLATGADTLCSDNYSGPALTRLPDSVLGTPEPDADEPESVSPPLDYAPKSSPYERGMLNEEFGLEKPQAEEIPEIPESVRH